MNPLLEQFLTEAVELLGDVDSGLLALERQPGDVETVNAVFRAAHTIKGSSGLFDYAPLTELTHAAEDVLDAVRAGALAVDPAVIDDLMRAFDTVAAWLGVIGDTELLPDDAAPVAAEIGAALRCRLGTASDHRPTADRPVVDVSEDARRAAAGAYLPVHAVRYVPDEACYFRGEDPLHLVRQVDDILHLDVEHPPVEELAGDDPYRCRLVITVVTTTPPEVLEHLFRYVADEVEIGRVAQPVDGAAGPDPRVRILDAQRRALDAPCEPDRWPTRVEGVRLTLRKLARRAGDEDRIDAAAMSAAAGDVSVLHALIDELGGGADDAAAPSDQPRGSRTLRVDQAKVDRLLELAGELVVAKNALPFLARDAEEVHGVRELSRAIKDQYAVVNRIAEELQEAVMDVRMLPMETVFQRFPRLVRDLARKLDKQVELVVEGGDTAADKNILEQLADPLVHLVRNSLDHGIEPPAARVAAGKAPEATIEMRAWHEGDSLVVTIVDDGRGIDPAVVKARAVERGMVDAAAAAGMADEEAVNLVFAAGFSTAAAVSDVSGRGVGMDAVRSTVDAIGGTMRLASNVGEGTTVTLRLPLSMAVSRVMVLAAGGQRFGVDVDDVRETIRVPRSKVQSIRRQAAIVLRGGLVPLFDLAGVLGLPSGRGDEDASVLVVDVDGERVGLVVDRFHENVDTIVKPLEGVIAGNPLYTGTALLGDGGVLLVLDLREVLGDAGLAA